MNILLEYDIFYNLINDWLGPTNIPKILSACCNKILYKNIKQILNNNNFCVDIYKNKFFDKNYVYNRFDTNKNYHIFIFWLVKNQIKFNYIEYFLYNNDPYNIKNNKMKYTFDNIKYVKFNYHYWFSKDLVDNEYVKMIIKNCKFITSLSIYIDNKNITSQIIPEILNNCKYLTTFKLYNAAEQDISQIANYKQLTSLKLHMTRSINVQIFEHLFTNLKLTKLSIKFSETNITDDNFVSLIKNLTLLNSLSIILNNEMSDLSIKQISNCKLLTFLSIDCSFNYIYISDENLKELKKCTLLEKFYINYINHINHNKITHGSIQSLIMHCKKLKLIHITCSKTTEKMHYKLLQTFSKKYNFNSTLAMGSSHYDNKIIILNRNVIL